MYQPLILIAIGIVFFYFVLWRPEQKRRKSLERKQTEMKVGDTVIAMGFKGVVDSINEKTVILKLYDGAKIEVLRRAITDIEIPASQELHQKA